MLSGPQNSASDNAIADRLAALRQRIAAAAAGSRPRCALHHASGREKGAAGRSACARRWRWDSPHFGENYLHEALPKIEALRDAGAEWHFIGRLQANKTRPVAEHFSWVHSVDRLKVAERLSVQRPQLAPPLNVCVQVNIAGRGQQGRRAAGEALALLHAVAALPRLRAARPDVHAALRLQTPAQQRADFGRLRELLEAARAQGLALDTLSMGMSADLEQAVRPGLHHGAHRHGAVRRARLTPLARVECAHAQHIDSACTDRPDRRRQHGARPDRRTAGQGRQSGPDHRGRSGRRRPRRRWSATSASATTDDNAAAAGGADVVVLAVKPQQMSPVARALAPALQRARPW